MIVVMLTAGIFAGMVLYTVSVMRQTQIRILAGELTAAEFSTVGEDFSRKSD